MLSTAPHLITTRIIQNYSSPASYLAPHQNHFIRGVELNNWEVKLYHSSP
jgi:hypothetical protein